MDRRLLLLVVAVVALVGVVNATVYAYRWIRGEVTVAGPDEATGAACTGFYSSTNQSGIDMPNVGTNYNAPTYGSYRISVTPGDVVCNWTKDGTEYKLYESIEIIINITVGSWYIQDFYGFGYYGDPATDPTVYVWFRLEDPATEGGYLTTAKLVIYKVNSSGTAYVTELNLLGSTGTYVSAGSLNPREAFRLDLWFDAASDAASAGTVIFKVGVYVSQENKAPNIPTS
jgi:hypothetical protein